jgi:hypothetical protein
LREANNSLSALSVYADEQTIQDGDGQEMQTNRSLHRLLDPSDSPVTLQTADYAARALGKQQIKLA